MNEDTILSLLKRVSYLEEMVFKQSVMIERLMMEGIDPTQDGDLPPYADTPETAMPDIPIKPIPAPLSTTPFMHPIIQRESVDAPQTPPLTDQEIESLIKSNSLLELEDDEDQVVQFQSEDNVIQFNDYFQKKNEEKEAKE